eukprot:gene8344-17725_t
MMWACAETGASSIQLLAAAPVAAASDTVTNVPQLVHGTYWYRTDDSMGFSKTSTINQLTADDTVADGNY